jgi:hypothetical protein
MGRATHLIECNHAPADSGWRRSIMTQAIAFVTDGENRA